VVALHACGDLSDLALDFASRAGADFMVCPCCYTKRYIPHFEPAWCQFVREEPANMHGQEVGVGGPSRNHDNNHPFGEEGIVRGPQSEGITLIGPASDSLHAPTPPPSDSLHASMPPPPPSSLPDQILGRLAEMDNRPEVSQRAQNIINSMRMAALHDLYDVSLESYQGDSSKRNAVLVGTRRKRYENGASYF
jgi:Methyltransferase domain